MSTVTRFDKRTLAREPWAMLAFVWPGSHWMRRDNTFPFFSKIQIDLKPFSRFSARHTTAETLPVVSQQDAALSKHFLYSFSKTSLGYSCSSLSIFSARRSVWDTISNFFLLVLPSLQGGLRVSGHLHFVWALFRCSWLSSSKREAARLLSPTMKIFRQLLS